MQTSVSMAREPEEGEEKKMHSGFFELNIPNGARLQMAGISLHCIVRPFIKISRHH